MHSFIFTIKKEASRYVYVSMRLHDLLTPSYQMDDLVREPKKDAASCDNDVVGADGC